MSTTIAPPDHDVRDRLKEFLIFRVNQCDGHEELADDSALQSEAARYAALMDDTETDSGIHYEVRRAHGGRLLYTTEDSETHREESSWRQTATW